MRNLGKFRPISVGLADRRPTGGRRSGADIFFARLLNIGPRQRDGAVLASLKEEGIKVDFVFDRIDRTEYLRRMAQAHPGWSPEGIGWQCFCHFEAAAMVASRHQRPRIELPEPLRHGEHCFDGPHEDDMLHIIRSALADKERLRRMGEAARRHVMRYHTHGAVVSGMLAGISEVLGRDPLRGGPGQA